MAKKNAVLEGGTGVEAIKEKNETAAEGAKKEAAREGVEKDKSEPVEDLWQDTFQELKRRFPTIRDAVMDKAEAGDLTELKVLAYLIEKFEKFGNEKAAKQQGGKTLGEMLLEELKRRQDAREAAADAVKAEESTRTNEASSEGAKSGGEAEDA